MTVLAVGTWLEQYTGVADRILRGGHELGNHTLHHRPMRPVKRQHLRQIIGDAELSVERVDAWPGDGTGKTHTILSRVPLSSGGGG